MWLLLSWVVNLSPSEGETFQGNLLIHDNVYLYVANLNVSIDIWKKTNKTRKIKKVISKYKKKIEISRLIVRIANVTSLDHIFDLIWTTSYSLHKQKYKFGIKYLYRYIFYISSKLHSNALQGKIHSVTMTWCLLWSKNYAVFFVCVNTLICASY